MPLRRILVLPSIAIARAGAWLRAILLVVATGYVLLELILEAPRRPTVAPNIVAEIVPASDWSHVSHETYDSCAGWWTSPSLGLEIYYDEGLEFIVGRYAREYPSVLNEFEWTVHWKRVTRNGTLWIDASYAIPTLGNDGRPLRNLDNVRNLSSRRQPAMSERVQLAHMLWRSLDLCRSDRRIENREKGTTPPR